MSDQRRNNSIERTSLGQSELTRLELGLSRKNGMMLAFLVLQSLPKGMS